MDFDGESCAQPLRGVARFWGGSFEVYNVSLVSLLLMMLAIVVVAAAAAVAAATATTVAFVS